MLRFCQSIDDLNACSVIKFNLIVGGSSVLRKLDMVWTLPTWKRLLFYKRTVLSFCTRLIVVLRSKWAEEMKKIVFSPLTRYMPPTVPVLGKPCYAVVWSQLVVEGEKRGIRPFVVKINDGVYMSKGITSK